jgi:hypothetical protein
MSRKSTSGKPKCGKSGTTNNDSTNNDNTNIKDSAPGRKPRTDPHALMVKALETVTGMDMSIKTNAGRIVRASKELLEAGYTDRDVNRFFEHWKKNDWRWRRNREKPHLTTIKAEIGKVLNMPDNDPDEAKRLAEAEIEKAKQNDE